jgi:hypothetical protein
MAYLALTPDQTKAKIEDALKVLRERGALQHCPRCRHSDWQADLLGFFVSVLPVVTFNMPPVHVPVLMLTCKVCGNVQLHNLNILGITVTLP